MSPRAAQISTPRHRRFAVAAPAGPPAEVLDAIDTAADVYDRLQAFGHHVHFELGANSGPGPGSRGLTIQILDAEGNLLDTLSPGELLDLASGAPLL